MSLYDELKRRKVVRVAMVYGATAFVVLQAADLLAAGLGMPDWVFRAITVMVVMGFPLALVLGWALEVTPQGIRRTRPAASPDTEGPPPALLGRGTLAAVALLLAVELGLGTGFLLAPRAAAEGDGGVPGEDADAVSARSVAVLPFADYSPRGTRPGSPTVWPRRS